MNKLKTPLFLICIALLNSCAVKKYIPEDTYLYTKGEANLESEHKIEDEKYIQEQVDEVLFPEPNAAFWGFRPGLHFYYKAQRDKPGIINKFLNKKIGEEPVYFDEVNIDNTKEVLVNRLENLGYFNSAVTHEINVDSTRKQKSISYAIQLKKAYKMNSIELDPEQKDSLAIFEDIKKSLVNSLIDPKKRFDLSVLKAERERIHADLKENGYYNFDPNFLIFEIDTNQHENKRFDLYLRLKNEVPEKALSIYKINKVEVFPNVSLSATEKKMDSIVVDGIHFYQDSIFFKPERLRPFILIEKGNPYQASVSRSTSRRLAGMNTYKFVNIEYEDIDSLDQNNFRWLNTKISLSPLNKRSLRFEVQGVTKSNNFTGPNVGVTYINRNLFKSGVQLRLNSTAGYERQFLSGDQNGLSSLQLGLRGTLSFPRLLFPIDLSPKFTYSIPKTNISLGVDLLDRTDLYTLSSFSGSFGYSWDGNKYVRHTINPLNIEYLSLQNTSSDFEEILDSNPFLRRSFEQQFIAGLTYSFTFNSIEDQLISQGMFFNFNFETAGNTLGLLARGNKTPNTFLDLAYAQYVKSDIDFRYHYAINEKGQKLVGRVFAGLGLPYGNSNSLPFVKQYFAGGPYSVRGFRIRSLGPGTYLPEDETNSFFDQAGDIRLEANLEYRFPIISFLNGAFFTDAGNVWLMNENPALPGGKFSSSFIEEFGISSGFGLRIDVTGFVIRFDLAAPIKKPAQKWDFEYDKPVFNFAIGYPF